MLSKTTTLGYDISLLLTLGCNTGTVLLRINYCCFDCRRLAAAVAAAAAPPSAAQLSSNHLWKVSSSTFSSTPPFS